MENQQQKNAGEIKSLITDVDLIFEIGQMHVSKMNDGKIINKLNTSLNEAVTKYKEDIPTKEEYSKLINSNNLYNAKVNQLADVISQSKDKIINLNVIIKEKEAKIIKLDSDLASELTISKCLKLKLDNKKLAKSVKSVKSVKNKK
jgi:hypothetical protein